MNASKYSGGAGGAAAAAWAQLTVGQSAVARAWAYAAILAGASVILWLPLPTIARATLAASLLAAALRTACREGCGAGGPVRVSLTVGGEVTVERPGRPRESGPLHPGSVAFTRLVIVRYRPSGLWLTRAVLVLPDAADPDAFRRLRVLLRAR